MSLSLLFQASMLSPVQWSSGEACPGRSAHTYLDIVGIREKHGESIDAHAPAGGWGQPVFQGSAEVLIYEHGLIVTSSLGLQ